VNELHLYRRETLAHGPDSFPASTHDHLAIVEAVARRDGEEAARLLYEHAMESRERLHRTLDRPHPAAQPLPGAAAKPRRKP
jgi:DNA-binding GntR family transcriptional regulator